ncbi:MAG: hypothetical protein ACRDFB_09475, partial [Rhabdochlamydiaceae bacterium]
MKSFSDYLRKLKDRNTKPKEGFVSIKKKDLEEIDKLLKKPTKPIKEDVGLTKSDIESYKYSPENPHKENDNPFHQAYLEKTKTMPHRTVIGGIVDKEQARRDRKEFGHHHQLNTAHEREGNQFKYTVLDRDAPPEYKAHTHEPLKEYTRSSHNLNRYLVNKHLH